MSELTEDFTYFRPLSLFLQDESELGADVDVADVVEQNPDHAPGQMHETAETHELTELEKNRHSILLQLKIVGIYPSFQISDLVNFGRLMTGVYCSYECCNCNLGQSHNIF